MCILACLSAMATIFGSAQAAELAQPPATAKPAYCINEKAEFYPYKAGDNCKPGYQLGDGNCLLKDGKLIAVAKTQCDKMDGDVALPAPAVRLPGDPPGPNAPPSAKDVETPSK